MNQAPRALVALMISLLLTLACGGTGRATVMAPNVLIRGEAPLRALHEGEAFAIPFDVLVREEVTVQSVVARADGSDLALQLEPDVTLARQNPPPGYRRERHVLKGTLEAGLDRVRLQVTAGGEVWEEAVSLRSLGHRFGEEDLREVEAHEIADRELDPAAHPTPGTRPSGALPVDDAALARRAPRTVNVTGRMFMQIEDTGPMRFAEGVTVYFMQVGDIFGDHELGRAVTDVNGWFSFDVQVDGTPTVYVAVRTFNDVVTVGTDAIFQPYGRNIRLTRNFAGTVFDTGPISFVGAMNHAIFLTTTYTRTHRWFVEQGYVLPQVNCRWPDDVLGSSVYLPILGMEGIHLRSESTWNAGTIVHEYGHHFVHASPLREVWPPFYTNGICDPGHCGPCPENEAVAWSEGVPNFLQQLVNEAIRDTHGYEAPRMRTYETPQTCWETGNFGENPPATEDFLAAFLYDLIDARPDDSPLAPGVFENIQIPLWDVLYVARTGMASNSLDFVEDMRAYVATTIGFTEEDQREFWAAAAVNGFDTDTTPPLPPTSMDVPTHPLGVVSPSNVPAMTFFGATDDNSGVVGYRVDVAAGPGMPGSGAVFVGEPSLVWPTPLAEGTYTINVTSVDRAGLESTTALSRQIQVGPPAPLDLVHFTPPFWDDSLLIRHDTTVASDFGPRETDLVGGVNFWLSLSTMNDSPSGEFTPVFRHWVKMNGQFLEFLFVNEQFTAPGEQFQFLNRGPFVVPGGRHHFESRIDYEYDVDEGDESNNRIDRFLVFRPATLTSGTWQTFPAPPWSRSTRLGVAQPYPNVAGHRVTLANGFAGVVMLTSDASTDNTLRAHPIATSWNQGFAEPLAISDTREGQSETVVVNRNALAVPRFDVGVERVRGGSSSQYTLKHVDSQLSDPGDDLVLNWDGDERLALIEYVFTVLQTGPFSVRVEATFDDADAYDSLRLFWMTPTDDVLVPVSGTPLAITDETGRAALELVVPSSGTYCLVVHRDAPASTDAGTPLPVSIAIRTEARALPDLAVLRENAGWQLPFLPSIEPVQGPQLTIPLELFGEGFSTYLNFGVRNLGQLPVQSLTVAADLDGVSGQQFFFAQLGKIEQQGSVTFNSTSPVFVRGGRHTMTLLLDPFGQVEEMDESNNAFAMQFGWAGLDLLPLQNLTRSAPPAADAGREFFEVFTVPVGNGGEDARDVPVNAWFENSDGFRIPGALPRASGKWMAVATMPGAQSDVDVRLHEVMPPIDAFGVALVQSSFGPGESDFVLVDTSVAPTGPYDVSVVNRGGSDDYVIVQVLSQVLPAPDGEFTDFGFFAVDGGGFLQLYDLDLQPGRYTLTLDPYSADADMGLSVFGPTLGVRSPWRSKDDGRDQSPMAYVQPAGQAETVVFDVPWGGEGTHCVAVWKTGAPDFDQNQDYGLLLQWEAAPAPCVRVDGSAEAAYGPPLAVQTVQTGFGDADEGQVDAAGGSELDQLFARICDDVLYVTLAGNLESNYNDLELFIDTRPGGQNRLRGDNADFGDRVDLDRMGDDGSGNGLTFDPNFEPDWWFGVQGGFGEAVEGIPFRLFAYQAELLTQGGGTGRFLGATVAASNGILAGPGSDNPEGIRVTIDNSNTAGVSAGTGPASGAGVVTGVEWAIPLSALGNPEGCVRLFAFLNGRSHDFVSNQTLPSLPVGTGNLGDPRDVDFGAIDGTQYAIVCQGTPTDAPGDTPVPGARNVALHQPTPNPFNPRTLVAFDVARPAQVELVVYDLAGRRVRTLLAGELVEAGRHELVWSGLDDQNRQVASGSYLLRLDADGEQHVRRMVLLK